MYGCCSTECATIIHLKKSKSHSIKNEIRFSKRGKSELLKNNADPLAAIPTTELAKRKPVAKKSGEN
jgi:hypothetical protein